MAKYVLYILLIFVSWEGLAQNTSNLSGSFDIGPVGNATYNIPVDLPPGTAGLKPDISIVYNLSLIHIWQNINPGRILPLILPFFR